MTQEFLTGGAPKPGELEKINAYTRREFSSQELYTFTVVLCDNEIDRDFERFTSLALEKLAALFLGKTGIFDHSPLAKNQSARIFDCLVESISGRVTQAGEPYHRLTARAYLPRGEQNEALILELESGIKKEVSVGCAVAHAKCSICGADQRVQPCAHQKGKIYEGKLCHILLDSPTDAYEWSFVAVPAQREAGVVKGFYGKGNRKMENVLKNIRDSKEQLTLTQEQKNDLLSHLEKLEKQASCGLAYREELRKSVRSLCALTQPELSIRLVDNMTQELGIEDLVELEKSYRTRAENVFPFSPQLSPAHGKGQKPGNTGGEMDAFRI